MFSLIPLSHGPKNAGQIRVESGFNPDNIFHMRESTPDTEAGQTLLPTQGRIQVKNGGQGSYATDDEGVASGRFGRCTFSEEESFDLTALITWLKRSAPLWPTASPDSFV